MSQKELLEKIKIISFAKDQKALIEAKKLEYITKDNKWQPISNLPLIPVIIEIEQIEEKDSVTYRLLLSFPYTHESITPKYIEEYKFEKNNENGKYVINYITRENEKFEDDNIESPIRYNNDTTPTLSYLKYDSIVNKYIAKNKRKIFELNSLLDLGASVIIKQKEKQKTK